MGRKKRRFKRGTDKRGSLAYLNGESLKRRGGESKSEGSPPKKTLLLISTSTNLLMGSPTPFSALQRYFPSFAAPTRSMTRVPFARTLWLVTPALRRSLKDEEPETAADPFDAGAALVHVILGDGTPEAKQLSCTVSPSIALASRGEEIHFGGTGKRMRMM